MTGVYDAIWKRREWRVNGVLHRLDGPAVIYDNGEQVWYKDGKRHRIDGPARICDDHEEWYFDGVLHRLDGPAILYKNYEEWYKNGKLHRIDGPARLGKKYEEWRIDGVLHRLDGPAIIDKVLPDKIINKYFIHGKEITKGEHNEYIRKKLKHKNNKVLFEMMKTTFLTLKHSQIDTNDNKSYYSIPSELVTSIIEKIESSS